MDFAVLVKAVPRSDPLRYDPSTRRVVREGAELVLNPFDQRAIRVALELRRPGEAVSALSLGPPGAEGPLREARAMGVDRVLWLTDPAFAGSDTLVTARVLSTALRHVGHEVILAGARTTDSETGQVGAEVAALLDVPMLSEARAVRRVANDAWFDVTVDTPLGWAEYRVPAPLVLSVGEKIAKPLKVSPEAIAALPAEALERVSAPTLGLALSSVGLSGSPTVVASVEEVAPLRTPLVFAEGPVSDRVRSAVAALVPRLGQRWESEPEVPAPPSSLEEAKEVLVLVTDAVGELDPSALALVAEVRRSLPDHWPSAVWVGHLPPTESGTFRLESAGTLGGYYVPTVESRPDPSGVAHALEGVISTRPRALAALALSDPFGREVAGRVAARRGLGLIGDAVGMRLDPEHGIAWSKPSFGGRSVATIYSRTRPSCATVRPGAFLLPERSAPGGGFGWETLPTVRTHSLLEHRAEGRETAGFAELYRHDVIVAVGMGIGGPEGIDRVRRLFGPWHAGLVATRRVVDQGWVPRQLQVGLTGRSLAPRLGLLLGISGSLNHMYGWQRAPALLAVNLDPGAPVFRAVDVGIVGRVEEVLPPLVEALAPMVGS